MHALKVLVIAMGVLLVAGFAVLVATVAGRLSHRGEPSAAIAAGAAKAAGFGNATVTLPAGAKVVEMRAAGSRLVLRLLRADGGEALLVLDPDTGVTLGTIELRPEN